MLLKTRNRPVPAQFVNSPENRNIQPKSGQRAKEQGVVPCIEQRFGQRLGLADRRVPLAPVFRYALQMRIPREDCGCGLRSPAANSRKTIRCVAHQGQVIRDGFRPYAKLLDHTSFVTLALAPSVQLYDSCS